MCPDPEPMHPTVARKAEGAVVEPDPGAIEFPTAKKLELQRWMPRICLEQLEVLVCQSANVRW